MSDEPREVSALFRDVADGRLNEDASADFRAALRELVAVGSSLLGDEEEKSPA